VQFASVPDAGVPRIAPVIVGLVSVLLVSVCDELSVTQVCVPDGIVSVAAPVGLKLRSYSPKSAVIDEFSDVIDSPERNLTVSPTGIVRVEFGAPEMVTPLIVVHVATPIFGVTNAGDVANTSDPVPVSSEITPRSCADVVAANAPRLLLVDVSVPDVGSVTFVDALAVSVTGNPPD
jgi:hypothetical protein